MNLRRTEAEAASLRAIWTRDLLDSQPELECDELVQLAAAICGTPMGLVTLLALAVGCSSIPVDQRAATRDQILKSGEEMKAMFVREDPGLEQELAAAAGYFTARISGGKVVVGGANGIGVLVDNTSHSRTFMNASRVDVGVALGAGTDRILVILETRETFEQFRDGSAPPSN